MALHTLLDKRTPLPDFGVAVVTRWLEIPDHDTPEWKVVRQRIREEQDHDSFSIKETIIFKGEVVKNRVFRITKNKEGVKKSLGYFTYRYSEGLQELAAGHDAIVTAIVNGDIPVNDNGRLSACLAAVIRPTS